jgi:opacity protein-like surface antigen
MKKLLIGATLSVMTCAAALAEDVIAATIRTDGTTNTWTAAELSDALGLMNRKYWRDMQTHSGRVSWHGKLEKQELHADEKILVEIYEDGFAWTNAVKETTTKPATPSGIPERLAAIRAKRAAEKAVTNVVVNVLNVTAPATDETTANE